MAKAFLSAGHGGKDPGAIGNGLKEKDINLQILRSCKSELERHGVVVIASRTTDVNDGVREEVRKANLSEADLAVSFHVNAGGGDGFEVYYYTSNQQDKRLAQLCEKYVKEIGQNSRGLKDGNNLYWCKNTVMPSCLTESFFIDNATDVAIGNTIEKQKLFGMAYAKAILEYLGIEYKEEADMTKQEVIAIIEEYERAKRQITQVSDWAKDGFQAATNSGVLDGSSPKGEVTREMLATVLDRLNLLQ